MHHPTDRRVHTTDFVTPVVEQWVEHEINGREVERKLITHSKYFMDGRKYSIYQHTQHIYSYMALDNSDSERGRKEMFYFTKHSTHFIYGDMASDIW